jgi:biotin operon repressor
MTPSTVLQALSGHIGRARGISGAELARKVGCRPRDLRAAIAALREHGKAVCSTPRTGYYLADGPEDLDETCAFLRARAMHSLRQEAQLRHMPLPDLLGQLTLPI